MLLRRKSQKLQLLRIPPNYPKIKSKPLEGFKRPTIEIQDKGTEKKTKIRYDYY